MMEAAEELYRLCKTNHKEDFLLEFLSNHPELDVDYKSPTSGCSLLYKVVSQSLTKVAHILLDRGANVNVTTSNHQYTPLGVCCDRYFTPEIETLAHRLLDLGADSKVLNEFCEGALPGALDNSDVIAKRIIAQDLDYWLTVYG